ncbi:MAG TPA: ferritin family protein [Thermodesulfovibrionales bacterium]|nr:ferritin family protein [Thermodesulfovibrionales bacterium]
MISTPGIRYGAIEGIVASKATFYQQAAEKTVNPIGRRVFLSVMDDEKRLLEDFRGIPKERHLGTRGTASTRVIKGFLKKIKATTDDVEALKIAMDMEKESIGLYEKLSKKVRTPKEKALLKSLLNEEQQRYAEFSDTCLFLSDSRSWFMWDEHSIMDGGTPWA